MACFLTRGGCYISWERGAEVFEEWLIDHESACNIGNWQWLSCTAFYAMFYRMYSPVAFPQKWDKTGVFVRRYVPELARYPDKFIYEPWKAPRAAQEKAGCVIVAREDYKDGDGGGGGDDGDGGAGATAKGKSGSSSAAKKGAKAKEGGMREYPQPIFDFSERRTQCMAGMKDAYAKAIYGDDARVLDGSARALFPPPDEDGAGGGGGGGAAADDEVDDDEEGGAKADGKGCKSKAKAKTKAKGTKRERGQGTLDVVVKRARSTGEK